MLLNVNGIEQRCYKSTGEFYINNETIGDIISKLLPKEMEKRKDYLADIKIEINVHGVESTGLLVNTDYERDLEKNEEAKGDSF